MENAVTTPEDVSQFAIMLTGAIEWDVCVRNLMVEINGIPHADTANRHSVALLLRAAADLIDRGPNAQIRLSS